MNMKVFEKVMKLKTVVTTRVFAKSHTFMKKVRNFYEKSSTFMIKVSQSPEATYHRVLSF